MDPMPIRLPSKRPADDETGVDDANNNNNEEDMRVVVKRPALDSKTVSRKKHAELILELATKALVAVQELVAAESVARTELQESDGPFSSDEYTLTEAVHAIEITRDMAADEI